jgi:predicted TPR repeat methyltransferase
MSQPQFEQAKALFIDGLACYEAGRYPHAEQQFKASLALLPGRVSTLVNLAATQLKLAQPHEALLTTDQLLALEPGNRDALLHRGTALLELNRQAQALSTFEQLLAIDPTLAPVWSTRGDILRELGRLDDAAYAYEQAIAHGADAELVGYFLAALGGRHSRHSGHSPADSPKLSPRTYVQALFDGYAGVFEQHVVQVLRYRAHEVLTQPLVDMHGGRFSSALDLGCGTGLCGPLLKPLADRLTGVDLSAGMLEKARALGVYDHLAQGDVTEYLRSSGERHDLVVAADVLIYIGDLAPLFAAVSEVMPAGGLFCFSAEAADTETSGYELLPSLRYAHSQAYLRDLAEQHGFVVRKLACEPIREDQRQAIDGVFAYLARR